MNAFPHWDFALRVSVHAVRWNGIQAFLIQLLSREVIHLIFNKTRKDFRTGLFLFYYQCSLLLSKIFTWLPWFVVIKKLQANPVFSYFATCMLVAETVAEQDIFFVIKRWQ